MMQQHTWSGDSAQPRLLQKSYEWYTPQLYIGAVCELMGSIDIDPASCEIANRVVQAKKYYDLVSNGLLHEWPGKVFLNMPYGRGDRNMSNQEIWSCKLIEQFRAGITTEAVCLVNASTDTEWFQRLLDYPMCLVRGRICFWNLQGGAGSTHGSAFFYFGSQVQRFYEIFSRFGRVGAFPPVLSPVSLWEVQ